MTCEAQPSPQGQPRCPLVCASSCLCLCNDVLSGLSTQACHFPHKYVISTQVCIFQTRSLSSLCAAPWPALVEYTVLPCPGRAICPAPPWWSSFVLPCSGKLHFLLLSVMLVDTLRQLPGWSLPFLLCPWPLNACPLLVTIALRLSPLPFACQHCPLPLPIALVRLLYLLAFLLCSA